jgi:hypothetical protein
MYMLHIFIPVTSLLPPPIHGCIVVVYIIARQPWMITQCQLMAHAQLAFVRSGDVQGHVFFYQLLINHALLSRLTHCLTFIGPKQI